MKDLMDVVHGCWNHEIVQEVLHEDDAKAIIFFLLTGIS